MTLTYRASFAGSWLILQKCQKYYDTITRFQTKNGTKQNEEEALKKVNIYIDYIIAPL